jgi:uncharacterized repeat protein (TIGR03803 family)
VAAQSIQPIYSFTNHSPANPYAGLTLGPDGNFYGSTFSGGSSGAGTVFRITTNGALTVLANFAGTNGANPQGALTLGPDGAFYGTTSSAGGGPDEMGYGTVFRITTNGSLTTLLHFAGTNGSQPFAGLTLGPDGNFYGTTAFGGPTTTEPHDGNGTVFRITTNGTLTTLFRFARTNGATPQAGLTLGPDGNFYGTTAQGGSNTSGTVFRITTNGALTTLVNFNYTNNGAHPFAGLTLGPDGNLYGTTAYSGTPGTGGGTVFRITTGGVLTTLTNFHGVNLPEGALALAPDGSFYGTTFNGGGPYGYGTVFRITTNGTLTTLAKFANTNGANPFAALTLGPDGSFYGSTVNGGNGGSGSQGTIFQITTGGALTTLYDFVNSIGANPQAGLTLGPDGNFYGTTGDGGDGGTVFRVTTNGILTTLTTFNDSDLGYPTPGLTLGPDGNFYGTHSFGAVFRITTNGDVTTLANFTGGDGAYPNALTLGPDNKFYGTTAEGSSGNYGTVFQVTTNGTLTMLASFDGTNGEFSSTALTLGSDNNFYGTAPENVFGPGSGTVFQTTTNGILTTLYSFSKTFNLSGHATNADGATPLAAVTEGRDGYFYGTTGYGGSKGYGTVFRITTNGTLTTLAIFASTNGAIPYAQLTLGPDGNFYGTTSAGGSSSNGTVFQITTNGMLSMLASFTKDNGANPRAGLTLGPDGNFYGTTYSGGTNGSGGSNGAGVIYRLNLPPSILMQPSNQTVVAGDNAKFNVTLFGTAPFAYQWLYDSTPLAGATNSTLSIPDAMPSGAGNYQVVVTNTWGSVTSSVATLSVIPIPPMITNQPANQNVRIGGTATFAVGAAGTPPLAYQWYFDRHKRQGPLPGATNAALSFGPVHPNLDGGYQVIVTSPYGSATSDVVSLDVLLRPNFVGISNSASGTTTLLLASTPGSTNRLWATTNLSLPFSQWQLTADTTGLFQFIDTNTSGAPAKFYILSSP